MTDRLKGCTVVFEKDIRDDDAQPILDAIKMIKGVLSVEGSVTTSEDWMAIERIRSEMGRKLFAVIYPDMATEITR